MGSPIPFIHLLCMDDVFVDAFEAAAKTYALPPSVEYKFHNERLRDLPPDVSFNLIVSPANSYARMDGGFDDALSRAFSPQSDYLALTRVAQAKVYEEWRGFAPPGTCTLVDLDVEGLKRDEAGKLPWGCRYLGLCPTMKIPQNVTWDREVGYECIWALLITIDKHNRGQGNEKKIESILMTPLATGFGGWSAEKWAAQTVLAIKHFVDAVENQEKWTAMGPIRIMGHCDEVEKTWKF